ncbi:inorganic phosphate transporter [Melioribacter sp. OK-6-Me]|uniref:inorganic phosphate transporter n=1 Tax=unclassified Melioribacter TaxID=2627329 RepID=UPI003ED85A93
METYLIFIIILFIMAISDLVVGVANDAVNFLNSAIGSKVAPRHIILIVSALGILVGTLFSSGMMEIARNAIFNPEMFYFRDVMAIFVAVMFTDILLLDLYNTFGIPTSTTVSLISGLLGGSMAVASIKILQAGQNINEIGKYINTARVSGIFSAIFLSVIISFVFGSLIQFISRLIFTFDYKERLKKYGAMWGALALTAITYFIFIKGARGTAFLSEEDVDWILSHTKTVLLASVIFWTVIFEFLLLFTKINILKPIVLIGTFSLALAFAANDLVNFIGVPLAGLNSYQIASMHTNPLNMTMEALKEPIKANTIILILAGFVMIGTLWINKKARSVTRTEINLGRQFEGYEKFESSALARNIVRAGLNLSYVLKRIIPKKYLKKLNKRFDVNKAEYMQLKKKDRPAFDYIRATVNMMVASSLISIATSYKLPLSTTYVTFMVAMATSFADKAWGRDSAVYRVNGVLTVIAGWIFTAFIATMISATFATLIYFGGVVALLILFALVAFLIVRTNLLHRNKEKKVSRVEESFLEEEKALLSNSFKESLDNYLKNVEKIYDNIYTGLSAEKRKKLKKSLKLTKELEEESAVLINKLLYGAQFVDGYEENVEFGKTVTAIGDIAQNLRDIAREAFEHIDNNHSRLIKEQIDDLKELKDSLDLVAKSFELDKKKNFNERYEKTKALISELDKNQIKYIKQGKLSVRTNLLFLNILFKTEDLLDNLKTINEFLKNGEKK